MDEHINIELLESDFGSLDDIPKDSTNELDFIPQVNFEDFLNNL
jgi:hypothetical protein